MKRSATASAGHRDRPRVQVEDGPALAEPDPVHAVMEVIGVGAVDGAAVLDPLGDDEAGVEERHGEDDQRADERDQGVGLERALDDHRAEQQAEQVRPAVAHEDRRRVEVVDEEAERRSGGDRGEHAGGVAAEVERDDRERDRRDRAHARREAVDPVGEVDDVHHGDEAEHGQRAAEVAEIDAPRNGNVNVVAPRRRRDEDQRREQLAARA